MPSPHASALRFQSIIEHSSEIFTLVDGDGQVTYVSPTVERILGYRPEELLGRNVLEYIPPEDRTRVTEALTSVRATAGSTTSLQARFRHLAGSHRILDLIGTNLLEDPAVRGIVVIARDVTEQVQLREQLLQSQKLEALGRLASGVAHDFNNLLTVISASAELLLGDLPAGDENRAEAERIVEASKRAARLTRQLLAFGRKQVLRLEPLDLGQVVRSTERLLERLIGEDVEVVSKSVDPLPCVLADAGQMEQVLVNLAVNARDAMPDGGVLVFETSTVTFYRPLRLLHDGEIPAGAYVAVSVTDSGTGMDQSILTRIFEPFFTTKERGRGTGLGLATVHGIVRQSGGHIDVHSVVGRGTTFTLYFPVAESREARATDSARPTHGAGARESAVVLLVEDEAGVRRAAATMLRRSGYEVLEAPNGADAITLAMSHRGPIDVLLTDMVMPGMDGAELARRIAAQRPGIGLVLMSGYSEAATLRRWEVPEGAVLLEKPFGSEGLRRAISAVPRG
jgi:PAS domain S-box-containing protein